MATDTYRPQLDGLRAVAVAAVAWSHWERPYQFGIPFGSGVHLFYVLSGFLITRVLLDVREQADRMQAVRAFYIRRALRIFPAFYLTLVLAWWADIPPVRDTLLWHAGYLSNLFVFVTGEWPGAISHLWSLAVEEQFYLIWPWLIVFAPRRWIVPAIVAAIAGAPLFRYWMALEGLRESLWAVLTPGCLDSLGVGALLSVSAVYGSRWTVDATSFVMAALLMLVGLTFAQNSGLGVPLALLALKQMLQAVVFGWMVVRASDGVGGAIGRVLSAAPVVYIGRISYGIYLAHGFAGALLALVGIQSRDVPEPFRFILLVGVTVGTAALSWHLFEGPLNALKRYFPYARAAAARGELRRPSPAEIAT